MASVTATGKAESARQAAPRHLRRRRILSPLTRRILAINLLAPALLAFGLLYLDQYRVALVDARIESLFVQSELIAGALGEYALASGEGTPALDPQLARQVIRRTVIATGARARLFDEAGRLLADSRDLTPRTVIQRALPPQPPAPTVFDRLGQWIFGWLSPGVGLPREHERPLPRIDDYPEALAALHGDARSFLREAGDGNMAISVAVPVQGLKRVLGALMLTVDSTEIDEGHRLERFKVLALFAGVLVVTIALSLFLAGTIARPVHRLAAAADLVRAARSRRVPIPDFSRRSDEIGDLSQSFGEMTTALYRRLDAIEAFAADVAHEVKNPLTSLRSAVETLVRTADPDKQRRLMAIVIHDVDRLNRLISDIANASRLDTELARMEFEPVDLAPLLATLVQVYRDTRREGQPRLGFDVVADGSLPVLGNAERLSQVARNLLDNAMSFSPPDGLVRVSAGRDGNTVWFAIEDDGPGVPDSDPDRIFDRFYSERPAGEAYGNHSGLGLSISRQIVETFGGSVAAANRLDENGKVLGARFTVRLPIDLVQG